MSTTNTEVLPARPSQAKLQPGALPTEVATRKEFGAIEEQRTMEISAQAQAARERAQIEALFVMAERRPRDWEKIETNLVKFCESPIFADAAVWERPVGSEYNPQTKEFEEIIGEGFSIRFVETAAQMMGSLYISSDVTVEMEHTRILRSIVVDVENILVWVMPDSISKFIDRKNLRKGDVVVSERRNSKNEVTYTVRAPEDQIRQKMNAALSRTQRNNILRVMPAHVKQHCWETLQTTFQNMLTGDERQKTIDKIIRAFDALGVTTAQLQELLGHSVSTVTDEEIKMLRGARNVIFEKQGTFDDILAAKKSGEQKAQEKAKEAEKPAAKEEPKSEGEAPKTDNVPVEDEPAGANESTPSGGGFLTGGVPIAALTAEEYKIVQNGLKVLGKAKTRTQIEDLLSRWATTKEEFLVWLEEELRKHEGVK